MSSNIRGLFGTGQYQPVNQNEVDAESPLGPAQAIPLTPKSNEPFPSLSVYLMPRFNWKTFTFFISIVEVLVFICELVYGGISRGNIHGVFAKNNMMAGPDALILETCGGKLTCPSGNRGSICTGQVWRLITPILLHAGVIHIVSNLFFQLHYGFTFEKRWTTPRFAIIYFVAGIGASLLSAVTSPHTVSVGASGALFGILGADLSYLLMNWKAIPQNCNEMCNLMFTIIFNFTMSSGDATIDSYAHFGGLLVGMAAAPFICPNLITEQWTFSAKCLGAAFTFGYVVIMSCLLFVPGNTCSKCSA